jgi:hypothetical protein
VQAAHINIAMFVGAVITNQRAGTVPGCRIEDRQEQPVQDLHPSCRNVVRWTHLHASGVLTFPSGRSLPWQVLVVQSKSLRSDSG